MTLVRARVEAEIYVCDGDACFAEKSTISLQLRSRASSPSTAPSYMRISSN